MDSCLAVHLRTAVEEEQEFVLNVAPKIRIKRHEVSQMWHPPARSVLTNPLVGECGIRM
jgi:hypothetical protein